VFDCKRVPEKKRPVSQAHGTLCSLAEVDEQGRRPAQSTKPRSGSDHDGHAGYGQSAEGSLGAVGLVGVLPKLQSERVRRVVLVSVVG